jgi:hypothetical protein
MIAISEPVAALTQGLRHLPQGNVASGDAAGQGAELCRHREYEQSTTKTALHAFLSTPHEKCRTSY